MERPRPVLAEKQLRERRLSLMRQRRPGHHQQADRAADGDCKAYPDTYQKTVPPYNSDA